MADKSPKKATQKGRGGTRERGPREEPIKKATPKMRKGAQEDQR